MHLTEVTYKKQIVEFGSPHGYIQSFSFMFCTIYHTTHSPTELNPMVPLGQTGNPGGIGT